jgi:MoxR-like ATPase
MKKKASPKSAAQKVIGRDAELASLAACIKVGRNVLLEGPVGVGKTHLALAAAQASGQEFYRVDGDSRYTEAKLAGWFDPQQVLKQGYGEKSFIPGPLTQAMREGAVLFINELNRLPEGVQNILLPAIDEKMILIPRLGEVRAKPGFCVIATQNPKEFVATSHLSEAILDRFEWIALDYPSEAEERSILGLHVKDPAIAGAAVRLARLTRNHPRVKRGASIRAALAIAELCQELAESHGDDWHKAFVSAVLMALPTRIELHRESEEGSARQALESLARELAAEALAGGSEKKKN